MERQHLEEFAKELTEIMRTTIQLERALRHYFDIRRLGHLRHHIDDDACHFWLIPNFGEGRSRVLGAERRVLLDHGFDDLAATLEASDWTERIESVALLLAGGEKGLVVEEVEPDLPEAWFPDPRGGYFFAYPTRGYTLHPQPPYIGLEGASWSAKGPETSRDPRSYSFDELRPFLPSSVTEEEA